MNRGLVLGKFLPYHAGHAHPIRTARSRADELTVLVGSIEREAIPEQDWIARLANGVASPLDLPLVAEADGRAIGLTWARISDEDPETVTLYQFWVHPGARRRGVGRLLVDAAIEWARRSNATQLVLTVALGPGSAIDFYRRVGFEAVGERTPLRPGSDALRQGMRRVL